MGKPTLEAVSNFMQIVFTLIQISLGHDGSRTNRTCWSINLWCCPVPPSGLRFDREKLKTPSGCLPKIIFTSGAIAFLIEIDFWQWQSIWISRASFDWRSSWHCCRVAPLWLVYELNFHLFAEFREYFSAGGSCDWSVMQDDERNVNCTTRNTSQ